MPTTRTAFLAAVGVAGLLLTFYPTLFSGFARVQPEAGDMLLNTYFQEHTYRWAFDPAYHPGFWSPTFFYPTPSTFTYSETLIGTAPVYWLLRVGLSEVIAAQVWMMVMLLLNYAALAVVLRWFGVHAILAAGGAFVFAYGLQRTEHLSHQQLLPHAFAPLVVWYAWTFLKEPTVRRWWLAVVLTAGQVLASLHLGWFLGFGLVIFAGWALVVDAGCWRRVWAFVRARPVGFVLPVVLSALILGAYARNFYQKNHDRREYWQAAFYLPDPDGWLVAPPGSLWRDRLSPRPADYFAETALFQGFTIYAVIGLAGGFALRRRFPERGLVLAAVGTGLTLAFLATSLSGQFSAWYLVYHGVPGANAFRAVGRIAFMAYLFGLIGGLAGVQALLCANVARPRARTACFCLIAGLMMLEQVRLEPESFDRKAGFEAPARALAERFAGEDAAYVIYDGSMPDYRHHILAMWGGLWADVAVLNGFSGTHPPNYPALQDQPTLEELVRLLGPDWWGRLAVIDWGPPMRKRVYQVVTGEPVRLLSVSPEGQMAPNHTGNR